jgi:hypothetical protein
VALPDYRTNNLALSLREVSRLVTDGNLDLNPPYQRGDVWTHLQRVNLIKSLLLSIPIAALILNRRGSNNAWKKNEGDPGDVYYAMIDGKQRTLTALMWFTDRLAVPTEWFRSEWVPPSLTSLSPSRRTDSWGSISPFQSPKGSCPPWRPRPRYTVW